MTLFAMKMTTVGWKGNRDKGHQGRRDTELVVYGQNSRRKLLWVYSAHMEFRKKPFKYISFNSNEYPNLVPAKSLVPEWYKNIPKYSGVYPPKHANDAYTSIKLCTPFLESLIHGYLVTTSYDMVVGQEDNLPVISWKFGGDFVGVRDRDSKFPVPPGFAPINFVWKFPVSFEVPPGYSFLVTHPLNRLDLPFYTLSGIIDGPYVLSKEGNNPFYIRDGFEGIIPQGTPIAQIIPIKNENWKAQKDEELEKKAALNSNKSMSVLTGWYKSNIWKRKTFE